MRAIHARHACLGLLDATTTTHKKNHHAPRETKKCLHFFFLFLQRELEKKTAQNKVSGDYPPFTQS
jgi:hypothetical protein